MSEVAGTRRSWSVGYRNCGIKSWAAKGGSRLQRVSGMPTSHGGQVNDGSEHQKK